MNLEELHASLRERGIVPVPVPPDIAEAFAYLVTQDELVDAGVPVRDLPTFEQWKASHGR